MRADRLIAILMLLQSKEQMTAEELAGELGVSVRTIYRDIATLIEQRVPIRGEAGIGKSRLIAELTQQDESKRVNFLIGRALSFGQNLSFHPVIDILKNWAGITEDDTPLSSSQKLEMAIRNVDPEGTTEVFPFIATLMGIKQAKAKAIRRVAGNSADEGRVQVRRVYPPERTKQAQLFSGDPKDAAAKLVERLRREARVL